MRVFFFLLIFAAGFIRCDAQASAGGPATNALPPRPEPAPLPNPADFHEVAPGVLEYHGIRFDKKNGRVSFPAVVNQHDGLIEYLLVNDKGKTHESLLATKIEPHDLHLVLLLLGIKPDAADRANEIVPPSAIDSGYLQTAPKIRGAPVRLTVAWTKDGKRMEIPAETWILNLQTNHPMTNGPWTYNGSMVEDGAFLADQEEDIVSVITDPTALVNNPRPGYDNDEIWQVRSDLVPPENTPVEVGIVLPSGGGAKR